MFEIIPTYRGDQDKFYECNHSFCFTGCSDDVQRHPYKEQINVYRYCGCGTGIVAGSEPAEQLWHFRAAYRYTFLLNFEQFGMFFNSIAIAATLIYILLSGKSH
jgi:hypothetical protein